MARRKGKVTFFNEIKGFGFIEYSGGHDIYFDRSSLVEDDSLPEGQQVSFSLNVNSAGETNAVEVRPDPETRPNRRRGPQDRRMNKQPSVVKR